MRRDGYICDECEEEHKRGDPAAYVHKDGGKELCEDCYEEYLEAQA